MNEQQRAAIRAAAAKVAAGWPPLTNEQLDKISLLLRDSAPARPTAAKAA
ncbi:hypothetical protein ACWEOE_10650 [Amycolatopsis sp. NPDC004368]